MKPTAAVVVGMLLVCLLASCGTRRGYRADDPYLYRRGKWNFAKGGIFDDIPQFSLQMLESMFDYGVQPVDPPSEYETATVLDTADAGGRYLSADAAISSGTRAIDAGASRGVGGVIAGEASAAADAAISSGTRAIDAGASRGVGGAIAAEAAAEAARAAASAAQPEMTWR